MTTLTDKYINPFTDFGFKKLFGEEANKDILIDLFDEDSLKYYRDLNNVIDTAFDDGVKIGREEGVKLGHETGLQEGVKLGHETGLQEGRQVGLQEGQKQGALQQAMTTAQKMRAKGLDDETITELTGLTLEQVQALR